MGNGLREFHYPFIFIVLIIAYQISVYFFYRYFVGVQGVRQGGGATGQQYDSQDHAGLGQEGSVHHNLMCSAGLMCVDRLDSVAHSTTIPRHRQAGGCAGLEKSTAYLYLDRTRQSGIPV